MRFRVWAPSAKLVEVELRGEFHSMQRVEPGYWEADLPAEPGDDYRYRLDNGPSLPDPRSPWQPEGPHGPSRVLDHGEFHWTDEHWQAKPLAAALIYELHVGTFTPQGTFRAVAERLDHLRALGVTHVELMPVAEFVGSRGWGYDGVDLYAPLHHYGTPNDLKWLVNACHEAGLAVLLDVVYNHLGPTGNYLPQFGPYFTDRHNTAWGAAINFDGPHSDEVRRFFIDNALMWLRDYHFDGLRLDAVHAILDSSAYPFLEQLAVEVGALKAHLGRHLVLIPESDLNDPRLVRTWEIGGYGLDAHWSDDVHHAMHAALTGECKGYYCDFGSIADLALALRQPYVYAERHSPFRQRKHGRLPSGLPASNFVVCLQNHDQVGNRAQGDRIGHLVSEELARVGAALTLLSPFVPMLFQGEEWNASSPFQYFVDFSTEPDLARAVSEGRPREFADFGWSPDEIPDPNDPVTFADSKLRWDELTQAEHARMLDWYKTLVRLRRTYPEFTDGQLDTIITRYDEQQRWLCVERGRVTLLCNLADEPRRIPLTPGRPGQLLLASRESAAIEEDSAWMPPESVVILGPILAGAGTREPFLASQTSDRGESVGMAAQ